MDRHALRRKSSNIQRQRTDRFVAPREYIGEMRRRKSWPTTCNHVDIWYSKYIQQKKYSMFLDQALDLETAPFQIPDNQQEGHFCGSKRLEDVYRRPWPCVPRVKRFLSSADSILDLPYYSDAPFPELLDWSNENVLVAALGSKYHKWSWHTQGLINQGVTMHEIHCCKYHPTGELLALGTGQRTVEIHDNNLNKCIGFGRCECTSNGELSCTVTAIDWSPTGNSYIIGCSRGVITSFSRNNEPLFWKRLAPHSILLLRISPDARYVAVAAVNNNVIHLLYWPSLECETSLGCNNWTIKTLTWHPWRSALLAVGAVTSNINARLALYNAPTSQLREYTLSCNRYYLDAMLFSHRTGELVLSLWNPEPVSHNAAQLVVMSDPDTAVDQWGEQQSYLDRVRHMVFSPDGTKLATATAAEDLIMWNFLPEDKCNKKKTQRKMFSAMPVFLDKTSTGFSLR